MSTLPDNEFDLEKLFLPAWAQEEPSATKYAKYEGREARPEGRGDRRGPRPPRRDGPGGPGREGRPPRRDQRGPGTGEGGAPRGGGGGRREQFDQRGPHRGPPRERREPPAPLPEIAVTLVPEEKGVESLARQIKITGRAYPLFDIAQMILQKPERHTVTFTVKKNAEGQPVQPLFVCALDDTLWLSEDEAVSHILKRHFATFYQAERTATEPPKGKYTFVAQCGMSGVVLGPPNYHDYQNQLRKLHSERFSRMPFEVYKSRVRIVRDEEVVKKWVDDQSWKTEYICLNMPESVKLGSQEAVEQHFREHHKPNIVKSVETYTMTGSAARSLRSPDLVRLVRTVWEDQRRFPLQIATVLSQQFASHGLQFFKVNKAITHVSVARPHYLDLSLTPVSDGVKRIVDYINANPKCTRRQLIEKLTPSPAPVAPPAPPAPAEGQPAAAPAPEPSGPTPEQNALIGDLHWLIHQGHVIEFANGTLETAKKPIPRPPKPAPKKEDKPAAPETAAAPVADTLPASEAPAQPGTPGQDPAPEGPLPEPPAASGVIPPEPAETAPGELGANESPEVQPANGAHPTDTPAERPVAPVESPS
ncbi:MAG TPA: hypothetical protein VKY92_06425 [Verrucomicrobiae bacterium]|nr:hypothetical protein [Verrucomicrobiae bacterium]